MLINRQKLGKVRSRFQTFTTTLVLLNLLYCLGEMPISMPNSSVRDEINSSDNFNTPNSDVKDVRRNSIPDSQAPSSLTNTLKVRYEWRIPC